MTLKTQETEADIRARHKAELKAHREALAAEKRRVNELVGARLRKTHAELFTRVVGEIEDEAQRKRERARERKSQQRSVRDTRSVTQPAASVTSPMSHRNSGGDTQRVPLPNGAVTPPVSHASFAKS